MNKIKSAGTYTGFAGNYIPAGSAIANKESRGSFWNRIYQFIFFIGAPKNNVKKC